MTLASLLSCSLLCRVLSVHFTSLDPHPASDLKHVDLYSGISVGPLFRSARHWFTSCWHNLCLSLSLSLVFRLTCCWPRAALWSWNLMRCLPFPSLFHSQEYFSVLSGLAEDGRIYRSLLQTLLNFSAKQTEICLQSFFLFSSYNCVQAFLNTEVSFAKLFTQIWITYQLRTQPKHFTQFLNSYTIKVLPDSEPLLPALPLLSA